MPRTSTADRAFPYYPAFLDLRHKRVVVVGGGDIATGKVGGLLPCGPDPLVVIAPEASALIQAASVANQLTWHRRAYEAGDLAGAELVFAATDDRALNATVATEARARRIPVLAVDDIPNCDLIAPSIVKRGDLTIAISTNGRSPAFARWLRERFDREVPAHWGDLLAVAGAVRDRLGADRPLVRPEHWLAALDKLDSAMVSGNPPAAEEWLLERLRRAVSLAPAESDGSEPPLPLGEGWGEGVSRVATHGPIEEDREPETALTRVPLGPLSQRERGVDEIGFVSLVGAGPGDPELLTVRALKRLREADTIVHDRLIGPAILDYCRADAERYDVGKSAGHHSCKQEEINDLLIRLARLGRRVVRLKGGDPFVFGRGGEEALALSEAGIPFEVVPGVSSALAAPEVAGIPVTHRGMAASVTIATGHGRSGSGDDDHDWSVFGRSRGTLVFLMAVENLEHIVDRLVANGRRPDEPAALIQSATTSDQRVVRATLAHLPQAARDAGICPPAVLVVGPTAALGDRFGELFRPSTC